MQTQVDTRENKVLNKTAQIKIIDLSDFLISSGNEEEAVSLLKEASMWDGIEKAHDYILNLRNNKTKNIIIEAAWYNPFTWGEEEKKDKKKSKEKKEPGFFDKLIGGAKEVVTYIPGVTSVKRVFDALRAIKKGNFQHAFNLLGDAAFNIIPDKLVALVPWIGPYLQKFMRWLKKIPRRVTEWVTDKLSFSDNSDWKKYEEATKKKGKSDGDKVKHSWRMWATSPQNSKGYANNFSGFVKWYKDKKKEKGGHFDPKKAIEMLALK